MRQTGEQHALQSDPSERIDQLARRDSATRDMGTDRCPIDVEAVEPKWNWPEFEIRVQSRLIVSRPLRLSMDQIVLSGVATAFLLSKMPQHFDRAPLQLCNLFGRECNSNEVTKNRNGRQATKGIGMAIWPQKE